MCGFFGQVQISSSQYHKGFDRLAHRGCDGVQWNHSHSYTFGHTLLALACNDPKQSLQPICIDHHCLMLVGEIYNYRSLRFFDPHDTPTDAFVACRALIADGLHALSQWQWMGTIAWWDGEALHLIRDESGKKSLYYREHEEGIVFASELSALRQEGDRLSLEGLNTYLGFLAPVSPHTMIQDIHALPPGSHLRWSKGKITVTPLPQAPFLPWEGDRHDAIKVIRECLEQSVTLRLAPHTTQGILLSGGIDSAIVTALATRHSPLPLYTIGYEGYDRHDERPFARQTAQALQCPLDESILTRDMFHEIFDLLIQQSDEPFADPAAIPLWAMAQKAHHHGIKTLLSGEGSDELFLGYPKQHLMLGYEMMSLMATPWLQNYLQSHPQPSKEWYWYNRKAQGEAVYVSYGELMVDFQRQALLHASAYRDTSSMIPEILNAHKNLSSLQWVSYIDKRIWLQEVLLRKVDRVLMNSTIEGRTPFMDRSLWDFVSSLPDAWRAETGKKLLKDVAQPWLDQSILERPKKGFSYPWHEWISSHARSRAIESLSATPFFNPDGLKLFLSSPKTQFRPHKWALLTLARWLEHHM